MKNIYTSVVETPKKKAMKTAVQAVMEDVLGMLEVMAAIDEIIELTKVVKFKA